MQFFMSFLFSLFNGPATKRPGNFTSLTLSFSLSSLYKMCFGKHLHPHCLLQTFEASHASFSFMHLSVGLCSIPCLCFFMSQDRDDVLPLGISIPTFQEDINISRFHVPPCSNLCRVSSTTSSMVSGIRSSETCFNIIKNT